MTSTTTSSFVPQAENASMGVAEKIETLQGVDATAIDGIGAVDSSRIANQHKDGILQFEGADPMSNDLLAATSELPLNDESSQTVRKWAEVRAYGFSIAGYNLLAPIGIYCEVITQFHLAPLPNAPEHCAGLIPLRGNLVPVYQLHCILNKPAITAKYALVIGNISRCAALVVEDKPTPMDFESLTLRHYTKESLPDIFRANVSACFENANDPEQPWYVLEHLSLFKELARLT